MKAEDFLKHINEGEFDELFGEDLLSFVEFASTAIQQGLDKIVIRFLLENENPDGIPTPWYLWAVYQVVEDRLLPLGIITPDETNLMTYLEQPDILRGIPFFEYPLVTK